MPCLPHASQLHRALPEAYLADGGRAARLAAVAGDAGCHACHTQAACTERCPKQLSPTATRRDDFARVAPESPARREVDAAIECIGCGVCYSSCDVVAWNPAYLGPAALNRAWTLQNDVRDGGRAARLAAVAGDAGCHACHTQAACTERCPKQLSPTAAIAGLKRMTARAALKGEL